MAFFIISLLIIFPYSFFFFPFLGEYPEEKLKILKNKTFFQYFNLLDLRTYSYFIDVLQKKRKLI